MRDKLIQTAIEKFGKRGFDGVGTREIAAAVGTPMSSITYHFGGKEGLYISAAEYIFDHLQACIGSPPEDFPGPEETAATRVNAITDLLRNVGTFMLSDESLPFALFIGREQQDPSPEMLALMERKMRPMMEALVAQLALLRPELDDAECKAVTVYLTGMALTLRHSRTSMCLLLGSNTIDAVTQAMLLDQLEQSARAILAVGGQ